MAYILLMKYFSLVTMIQKRPDYLRDKKFITEFLGGNTRIIEQMNQLEQLKNNLEKR